jgi:hypothetical protein
MAFIGNSNTTQGFTPAIDYFNGNGSTTAFTLSRPVASVAQVQVVIENVPQNPGSAYTVSGNTITFTSAPPSGTSNIYVYYTSPITQVIAPGQGTVNTASLNGGTVTTTADATIYGVRVGRGAGAVATNTAVGASALNANTSGTENTAVGQEAGYTNLTGNSNTFIGRRTGYLSTGSANTGVGAIALRFNSSGSNNTAVGEEALYNNTTASNNTAVGYQAGYANTTGDLNTAIGRFALYNNSTGTSNSALGSGAMSNNSTGGYNVGIGRDALASNTTASNNIAVGYQAAYTLTTAPNNTIIGYQAGYSKTTGNSDVLIGYQAGYGITTGADNVFIGNQAGYYITATTTGGTNIYIGSACRGSAAGNTREIAIGFDTAGKGSNTGYINPNGGGVYQGNNSSSWSTTSDQRLKKNIVDNTEGLDKITAIQVRNFEYRLPEEVTELDPSCAVEKAGVQLGVIAQELQQVCSDCVKEESTGVLSVDSDNIFWHMVNAIKELKSELDSVKAQLAALEAK